MSTLHPPIERLAELVDGTPTLFEREHVAGCARCTRELESYRRLVSLANDERRRIAPPLTSWDAIRAGLDAADLIVSPATRRRTTRLSTWTMRAASVGLLLATGTVAGRVSAGLSLSDAVALRPAPAFSAAEGMLAPVSETSGSSFRSTEDALAQLQRAQRAYEDAASYLAAHDTSSSTQSSDQYRTRLAALDMASATFEQALTDAPEDPIINQYYRATMSAREVAIRRLGTTLPVSVRMGRF
jgi:hypothetical protein